MPRLVLRLMYWITCVSCAGWCEVFTRPRYVKLIDLLDKDASSDAVERLTFEWTSTGSRS
jgi:hypothetical protein